MFKIIFIAQILLMAQQINAIEHINSVCSVGYELSPTNGCEPVCDQDCGEFATCAAPNNCVCFIGYLWNAETKECELECDGVIYVLDKKLNQCVLRNCSCLRGGYCSHDSNVCVCHKGYRKTSSNTTCEPACQPECKNADCIEGSHCKCWPGYEVTEVKNVCEPNIQKLLRLSQCKCKVDYVPYAIGIVALVISLTLVLMQVMKGRRSSSVGHPPQPLVEEEMYDRVPL